VLYDTNTNCPLHWKLLCDTNTNCPMYWKLLYDTKYINSPLSSTIFSKVFKYSKYLTKNKVKSDFEECNYVLYRDLRLQKIGLQGQWGNKISNNGMKKYLYTNWTQLFALLNSGTKSVLWWVSNIKQCNYERALTDYGGVGHVNTLRGQDCLTCAGSSNRFLNPHAPSAIIHGFLSQRIVTQ
jgi:hypothetical protein